MVGTSALQSVDLGLFPLSIQTEDFKGIVYSHLFCTHHKQDRQLGENFGNLLVLCVFEAPTAYPHL